MDLRDLTVLREALSSVATGPLTGLVVTTGLVAVVVTVVSGLVARSVVRSVPPGASVTARFGLRGVRSVAVVRSGGGPSSGAEDDRPVPDSLHEYVTQEQETLVAAARAYSFAFGLTRHQADDVFQEACYSLARLWPRRSWDGLRHLNRYMNGIIRNKALDMRYPRRRNDRLNANAARLDHPELDGAAGADAGPDEWALAALQEAIASLPERQREVVVRVELLGYSTAEVAEDLGATEAAVRQNLSRARAALRTRLGNYFGGVRDEG